MPPPTLRIRNLQDHLSLARTWLQHVRDNAPDVPGLDLDECLKTLDFTQPNPTDASSPTTTAPTPMKSPSSAASTPANAGPENPSPLPTLSNRHKPGNMLTGCDRSATLPSGETCFYGAFSDLSFALRTIELFRQNAASDEQAELDNLRKAFAKPFESRGGVLQPESPLPNDEPASLLSRFDAPHLLLSFIPRQKLKDSTSPAFGSTMLMPLLRFALSFQHLTDYRKHQIYTCHGVQDRACSNFHEGIASILPVDQDSLVTVQSLLCAANILLLMGRITAAHSIISTAASMALRLGLFVKDMALSFDGYIRTERIQALATVLALDMLLSLILDIPTCLPRDVMDDANLTALAQDFESDRDLRTAAMLRQVCLLTVPISIRDRTRRTSAATAEGESDAVMEDIRLLETAHAGFRRWKRDVSSLLTSLGPSKEERT